MKKNLFLTLIFLQSFNLFGQPCSSNSLVVRSIKAFNTDINIDWELQNHQVFVNTDCIPNNKLLLHLVGCLLYTSDAADE